MSKSNNYLYTAKPPTMFFITGSITAIVGCTVLAIFSLSFFPRLLIALFILFGIVTLLFALTHSYTIRNNNLEVRQWIKKYSVPKETITDVKVVTHYGFPSLEGIYAFYVISINTEKESIRINSKWLDCSELLLFLGDVVTLRWESVETRSEEECNLIEDLQKYYSYRFRQINRVAKPGLIVSLILIIASKAVSLEIAAWIYLAVWIFVYMLYIYFNDLYFADQGFTDKTGNAWSLMGVRTDYTFVVLHILAFAVLFYEMDRRFAEIVLVRADETAGECILMCLSVIIVLFLRYTTSFGTKGLQTFVGLPLTVISVILWTFYIPWLFSDSYTIAAHLQTGINGRTVALFTYDKFSLEMPIKMSTDSFLERSYAIIHESPFSISYAYIKGGFDTDKHLLREFVEALVE